MRKPARVVATLAALTVGGGAQAAELADLSLEELAGIEITSASRRAERLSDAAASVYVITADMIRRAGVSSLPEALRLAPNLQVARMDASQYAITARGFNNALGNKLLVLIDGRTVYTSLFSGVQWDQQDVMLEDVERIEVISGPGATLWGANAVNGVINVITRPAADTTGTLAVVAGGERESQVALRHGGALGDKGRFRVYAKEGWRQNTRTAAGQPGADGWGGQQAGFRADWLDAQGGFTLQGDTYQGKAEDRTLTFSGFTYALTPIKTSGNNLLARWSRQLGGGSDISVQAYHDEAKRDDALLYRPRARTFDLEFQHGIPLGALRVMWGGGYRRSEDDILPGLFLAFRPQGRTLEWRNLFVQGEAALSERLHLTLGTKLENNEYTGTEVLPSLRAAWKLDKDRLAWMALSRAVRAPARLDREVFLPSNPPYIIAGGPNFVSEVANVFELGWRAQPSAAFTYSATLFYHRWDRLRSVEPPPSAHVQNMIEGDTYGLETWGTWQVRPSWRLSAGLTTIEENLHLKPGSIDPAGPRNLGNDPKFQWTLRSSFNLPHQQELDLSVRRVDALPAPAVPAYTALDLRYGWRVRPGLELSVTAQNLFDDAHPEFGNAVSRSEFEPSVLLRLRWSL